MANCSQKASWDLKLVRPPAGRVGSLGILGDLWSAYWKVSSVLAKAGEIGSFPSGSEMPDGTSVPKLL